MKSLHIVRRPVGFNKVLFGVLTAISLVLLHGELKAAWGGDPVDISSYVSVSYTTVTTSYNALTKTYTATHTATLKNTSSYSFTGPLHGVLQFNNLTGTVTVPNALGGPTVPPYQQYYYDLTSKLPGGTFAPGGAISLTVTIQRKTGTSYSSTIIKPFGVLPALNQLPTANAGPNQTVTLQPGQATTNVTLSGSGSDPDGIIASYAWSGTPKPADVAGPTLVLGVGSYTFTLTVIDDQGAVSAPSQTTVTVNPAPNQAPTITTTLLPDGHSGRGYAVPVSATDPDGDQLTFSLAPGAPAGMTITPAGLLDWLPGAETEGNAYPLTVSVSDGRGGSDSRQYSVKIPDTTPPSVSFSVPKEALPGSSFPIVPAASDNVGVTELRLLVDGQLVKTFTAPPYGHDFTLPAMKPVGSTVATGKQQ